MTPTPAQSKMHQQLWDEYLRDDNHAAYQLFRVDVSPSVGIFRLCLSLTGFNIADAEEMHSRSLSKLLRRRNRYPEFVQAVRAWRRFAKDQLPYLAKRAARRQAILDAEPDRRPTDALAPADPAMIAMRSDDIARLRKELPQLAGHLRRAVELVGFEGLSFREAATRMECSDKTVATYYEQALDLLRSRLSHPSAAGVFAVIISASAFGRSLPSARLATAVTQLIDTTPAAGPSLIGYAAVAFSLLLAGGLAAGGYGMFRPVPQPPTATPVTHKVPTVEQANRAAFDKDVLPDFMASLNKLALGEGGKAELVSVKTFGTRVAVEVAIRHGKPLAFVTTLRVVFDTETRRSRWLVDRWGQRDFLSIPPGRSIILFEENAFGLGLKEMTLSLEDYIAAEIALKRLPTDQKRGAAVLTETNRAVLAEAARLSGKWTNKTKRDQPILISVEGQRIRIQFPDVVVEEDPANMWLDTDGQLQELFLKGHRLSADGNRIEFPNGEFWVREKK